MKPLIEVENISKKYRITHERGSYVSLRDVMTNIFKNPFRYAKLKAKQVAGFEKKEEFWALKDINFTVNKGEVIGIIGRNGAGKSTLLKILSQITPPTTGEIRMHGKIGSLLEVGTGFHPELTGRENIFLNGAILGMTKKEIVNKFDQIVEFAGITKFLDTPVKYYSSGMYVRLAFSIAAHMEHDILLVDEVLAVGDSDFQRKCLGKMEEVTKENGRTILFISHNMDAIQRLCGRTILLEKGMVKKIGPTKEVIDFYLNTGHGQNAVSEFPINENKNVSIKRISIQKKDGVMASQIPVSEPFSIKVEYSIKEHLEKVTLALFLHSNGELFLLSSESDRDRTLRDYEPGNYTTTIDIPGLLLGVGTYFFDVVVQKPQVMTYEMKQNIYFEITNKGSPRASIYHPDENIGKISSILNYKTDKID